MSEELNILKFNERNIKIKKTKQNNDNDILTIYKMSMNYSLNSFLINKNNKKNYPIIRYQPFNDKDITIFGENFVKNNKKNSFIILFNKKTKLKDRIKKEKNKDIIKIKLGLIGEIRNAS